MTAKPVKVKSFLNYIGSKQRYLPLLSELFPSKIERYFEPFLGGGSVLVYVLDNYDVKKAYVNDMESNLINAWRMVKSSPDLLLDELYALNTMRDKKNFERLIEVYNEHPLTKLEKAALFIYMSKVAFNASLHWRNGKLYPAWSENHAGINIFNEQVIVQVSKLLKHTSISNEDYSTFLKKFNYTKGDFVFIDPPYFVKEVGQYYDATFDLKQFQDLKKLCDHIHKKKANFMLTLNFHPELKSMFGEYNQRVLKKISALRNHKEQKNNAELVIYNY